MNAGIVRSAKKSDILKYCARNMERLDNLLPQQTKKVNVLVPRIPKTGNCNKYRIHVTNNAEIGTFRLNEGN